MDRRHFARLLTVLPLVGPALGRRLEEIDQKEGREGLATRMRELLEIDAPFSEIERYLRAFDQVRVPPTQVLSLDHQDQLFRAIVGEITSQRNWLERVHHDGRLSWLAGHRDRLRDHLFLNSPRDGLRDEHYYWRKYGGCSR